MATLFCDGVGIFDFLIFVSLLVLGLEEFNVIEESDNSGLLGLELEVVVLEKDAEGDGDGDDDGDGRVSKGNDKSENASSTISSNEKPLSCSSSCSVSSLGGMMAPSDMSLMSMEFEAGSRDSNWENEVAGDILYRWF